MNQVIGIHIRGSVGNFKGYFFFDAARRLYSEVSMPPTEGFDLVAREIAQRNPKPRDFDTKSVVDLQFVRELEQAGFLKSLKGN